MPIIASEASTDASNTDREREVWVSFPQAPPLISRLVGEMNKATELAWFRLPDEGLATEISSPQVLTFVKQSLGAVLLELVYDAFGDY